MGIYENGLYKVKTTPPPKNQKFLPGTFVKIADDLGPHMSHFKKGVVAQVEYTYAHAYWGDNVKSYSLLVRYNSSWDSVAWYEEHQLEEIIDQKVIADLLGEINYQRSLDRV